MKLTTLEKNILYQADAEGRGGYPMHKLKKEVIDGLRDLTERGYINALENDCFELSEKGKKAIKT